MNQQRAAGPRIQYGTHVIDLNAVVVVVVVVSSSSCAVARPDVKTYVGDRLITVTFLSLCVDVGDTVVAEPWVG